MPLLYRFGKYPRRHFLLSLTRFCHLSWFNRAGLSQWIARGNIIRDVGTGIEIGVYFADAVIENNVIASNAFFGIHNDRTPHVVIRNNTIVANGLVGYREQYGPPVTSVFVNNIVAFNGTAMTNAIHPAGFEAASPNYYIAFNNLFGNANGDTYGDYGGNCCPPMAVLTVTRHGRDPSMATATAPRSLTWAPLSLRR